MLPAKRIFWSGVFLQQQQQEDRFLLEQSSRKEQALSVDTTIIVTSSLIPTHPSINIVNETVNSIREMIKGLAYNTPILISVDGMKNSGDDEGIERLQGYVENLRIRFRHDPYVIILNNYKFGHISNSIRVALQMVETEFLYVVQHDFKFIKPINHTALVSVMKENPDQVQIVRFNKVPKLTAQYDFCEEYNHFHSEKHNIDLELVKWSDNNHFTTKRYYEKVIETIGNFPRCVEDPLMRLIKNLKNASDCTFVRQYLYNWREGPHIEHLDGRNTLGGAS